jgi:uncharacterized membrane protein
MAHQPGHCFWLLTRVADVISPGTGKHRINTHLQAISTKYSNVKILNGELAGENTRLRRELGRVTAENQAFRVQDETNAFIRESEFANRRLLTSRGLDDTVPLRSVNKPLATG